MTIEDILEEIVSEIEAEQYHMLAGFMLTKLRRISRGGEFMGHKNKLLIGPLLKPVQVMC